MSDKERSADAAQAAVTQLLAHREQTPDAEFVFGAERISLELEGTGNGPVRARKGTFEWIIDEPAERGGTDSGANPLAYFLSGAASCLVSHWMLCAIADGIRIETLKLNARAHFNRVLVGGAFKDVVYDVTVETPHSSEDIAQLAERAEAMCYAHNTLLAAGVAMTTNVHVNGELATTLSK